MGAANENLTRLRQYDRGPATTQDDLPFGGEDEPLAIELDIAPPPNGWPFVDRQILEKTNDDRLLVVARFEQEENFTTDIGLTQRNSRACDTAANGRPISHHRSARPVDR